MPYIQPIAYAKENNAPKNVITIFVKKEKSSINNKVFGNNLIAFDPSTYQKMKRKYDYMDYGAGIWNRNWAVPVESVMDLAKNIGISSVRFPGGCGTHYYDWKETIAKQRLHYWFGLDEFLMVAGLLQATPIITVSYFSGDEQDAADMVEYLNAPNDNANPNGGVDWAAQRAKNGHADPYAVKYFEIGNEVYHGNHHNINDVSPGDYAHRYLKYYNKMKAVDASIQIGVVLNDNIWNEAVASIIKSDLDFGIIHLYPSPASGKSLQTLKANYIFETTLAIPFFKYHTYIQRILRLLQKNAGRKIPLAVTEFNGGFVQEKPVPYRHSLGNALVNAELLNLFLQPENNIIMANHWQFNNSYTGMIANGFNGKYSTLNRPYYKRPNYYIFEIFNNHLKDILLEAEVDCRNYHIDYKFPNIHFLIEPNDGHIVSGNLIASKRWRSDKFAGVSTNINKDVLTLKFFNPKTFNYFHSFKQVGVEPATLYKLSGYIKTENLIDKNGVCLEAQDARGWQRTHSAASTTKVKGTNDWQFVETFYQSLTDAKEIKIIARRNGLSGPLQGTAYFKDIKFEKFALDIDTQIPYLSLNATKSKDGQTVSLILINKNLKKPMTAKIELKDFVPAAKAEAWVLNGPGVDATNEEDSDNVKVMHREFDIWNEDEGPKNSFEFTFDPHSFTAIVLKRFEK